MDLILAFSAGLLTFLSPCILPLIPGYFSYLVGTSAADINNAEAKWNIMIKAALFILGFSIIFILLGISISSLSRLLVSNLTIIHQVGGVLIMIFGLHMTGLFKIKLLYTEKRFLPAPSASKHVSALLFGMIFAAGWTPCVGPILSSILIYAGSLDTVSKGALLLAAYSAGMGVPFLLSALLIRNLSSYLQKVKKYMPALSIVSGIIIVMMGILVFTNKLSVFSQYSGWFNL